MAKDDKSQSKGQQQEQKTWGPGEGEAAADAYPVDVGVSRDAKDYVLVEQYLPEADGLRIETQVLKTDFEDGDDWKDISLDSENVKEAHPAKNRPTSDLREEEIEKLGRKRPGE